MKLKFTIICCFLLLFIVGCQSPAVEEPQEKSIQEGRFVVYDFIEGYVNGSVIDTSIVDVAARADILNPDKVYGEITIRFGSVEFLPGVEKAMVGRKKGDVLNLVLDPEDAYGYRTMQLIQSIHLESISNYERLKVGDTITISTESESFEAPVIGIGGGNATIDMNHPLAGIPISYSVIIYDVQ